METTWVPSIVSHLLEGHLRPECNPGSKAENTDLMQEVDMRWRVSRGHESASGHVAMAPWLQLCAAYRLLTFSPVLPSLLYSMAIGAAQMDLQSKRGFAEQVPVWMISNFLVRWQLCKSQQRRRRH